MHVKYQKFRDGTYVKAYPTPNMVFLKTPRTCIYANPLLPCTILERDMMSMFPNCVKNIRVQALSDSVKLSRRLMQKMLDLLSCDLTTYKDQSYRVPSRV